MKMCPSFFPEGYNPDDINFKLLCCTINCMFGHKVGTHEYCKVPQGVIRSRKQKKTENAKRKRKKIEQNQLKMKQTIH